MLKRPSLTSFDGFPEALLEVPAAQLWRHLPGPSLFMIEGRDPRPLFVSVLLHGNEDTGWQAMQAVLRAHARVGLARALILFIGNVEAAKARVRTLPGQCDYNRTWPGTLEPEQPEARLMSEVVVKVARQEPFASIDIHNNTGNNPHYACLNRLDGPYLHLARLFSRTVVYFTKPLGVQSATLARHCPAVTLECGRPGTQAGAEHAAEFISAALALSHFPDRAIPDGDIDLMQTVAILKVPAEASFSYDGADADFKFRPDLDQLNFSELAPGVSFGALGGATLRRLEVIPGGEFSIDEPYFAYREGEILLSRPAIPAMLTVDANAVRLDCLGYLMHRIRRDGGRIVT